MLISNFKVSFNLPFSKKKISLREISNFYYLDLLKYLENNNSYDIEYYFNFLISELTNTDISELSNIDKFYILLELRALSLGSNIDLVQDNTNFKINIDNILKKLTDLNLTTKHFRASDIEYELSIPKNLYFDENIDIYHATISKIDEFNMSSIHDIDLASMLPANIFTYIKNYVTDTKKLLDNYSILDKKTHSKIEEWPLNVYNNSLFDFLKLIYHDNLMNFYEMQFNLLTKMHISYDHFMSMTFNESKLFINLQNKEIKKQEEAEKKKNSGHPLPL